LAVVLPYMFICIILGSLTEFQDLLFVGSADYTAPRSECKQLAAPPPPQIPEIA
jgi:hypothetical protein